ncbi:GSCOCG00002521001-RA-CDS [Cotesia congregata]|nr:GSCOCG00002521001-RA-CDS [Cotesia congregata]
MAKLVIMTFNPEMYVKPKVWFPCETCQLKVRDDFYQSSVLFYQFSEDDKIIIRFKSQLKLIKEKKFIVISVCKIIKPGHYTNQKFIATWSMTINNAETIDCQHFYEVQEQIGQDDFPLMFVPVWYLTRNYGPDDKYTINIEVEKKPPGTD